jgi:hypothetical protein
MHALTYNVFLAKPNFKTIEPRSSCMVPVTVRNESIKYLGDTSLPSNKLPQQRVSCSISLALSRMTDHTRMPTGGTIPLKNTLDCS